MSQTETYELQPHFPALPSTTTLPPPKSIPSSIRRLSQLSASSPHRRNTVNNDGSEEEDQVPLAPVAEVEEKWNQPGGNMYRTFATFWALFVMGMNDAAYGALIPYLEDWYHLSYTVISLIFLSPFVGYTTAAILNNTIHQRYGQRGIAVCATVPKIIPYVVISLHPPYPVLIVMYLFVGFGNGLEDAAWNAWVGAMQNANEVLGFLHGFYGLGATVSPLVATSMVAKAGLKWYQFYYIMIAAATIELLTSLWSFYPCTGASFRATHPRTTDSKKSHMSESLFQSPNARITWLCALFLFGYVGAEVAIGGWVVSFMLRVREGSAFASGMAATGFWLGITVGRVVLGFVTGRLGERRAIAGYLAASMGFLLLFWLVPSFLLSAVAVAMQGFFLGPLFPAAVVVATKLLPKHLHVSAIGFAAAFGGTGGAALPFAVGAIAQRVGVRALQPIILGALVVIEGLWLGLPRLRKRE